MKTKTKKAKPDCVPATLPAAQTVTKCCPPGLILRQSILTLVECELQLAATRAIAVLPGLDLATFVSKAQEAFNLAKAMHDGTPVTIRRAL